MHKGIKTMFQHFESYAGDPILSLVETFQKDTRTQKVNLGIGLYYDEQGRIPLLASVKQAEGLRTATPMARPYLPMEGALNFREATQHLLWGKDHPALAEQRISTIQTLGGSGALKIGADIIKRYFPNSVAYVSNPTWDNHRGIFEGAGFTVKAYPYFDASTGGVDFEGMKASLNAADAHSVFVLHPCCHNPTGVDLTHAQWDEIIRIVKNRQLIAFMDIAYQGFGDGLTEDVYAILAMTAAKVSFLVGNSYSKNMSLYGERCGALSVICQDKAEADLVLGQLKLTVRRNYSSPPTHGSQIIAQVLQDDSLRLAWENEVTHMRDRIKTMRQSLFNILTAALPHRNFDYFIKQRGMFSYTGLTPTQVDRLRDEFAIYLVQSGRMCIAGLNDQNIHYVAESFATVLAD
jgi:aromatic-amino-acid transaminase